MKNSRIYSLDLLKFLAIIVICLLHFDWHIVPQGYLMVELFFMITGFFIALGYERYRSKPALESCIKRISSYYFYYLMAIILSVILSSQTIHFSQIISSLFFFGDIGLGSKITSDHLWFLGVYTYIFAFYILLTKAFNKQQSSIIMFCLTGLALLAMAHYSPVMNVNYSIEKDHYIFMIPFGIVRAIAATGTGFLIGMAKQHMSENPFGRYSLIIETGILLSSVYIITHRVTPEFDFIFYPLCAMLLWSISYQSNIFSKALEKAALKLRRIFVLSLPLYVFHYYIFIILNRFTQFGHNLYVYFILIFAFSYLMVCVRKLCEKILRLIKTKRKDK